MRRTRSQSIAQLAAADPAAGLIIDERTREECWRSVAVTFASAPDPESRSTRGRLVRRAPALALVAMLLIVGAAIAGGLVTIGSPARKIESFQIPDSGFGTVVPGSAKLLAVRADDPQGGPPWGLRVFTTTRGAGCIQLGRVVDGQIGVLGTDGAYGDDGQLHPLAVASTDDLTCSALDASGRIFGNVSKGDQLANGMIGPEQVPSRELPQAHDVCAAAAATAAEQSSAQGRICPQSSERDVFYGLLGPDAESITYVEGGHPVTLPTSGPEGAYLIVQNAPGGFQPNDAYGAGETGPLPVYGPITEIHYTSGAVCHVGTTNGPSCAPSGVPVGYVAAEPEPSASQAKAPLSAQLVPVAGGHVEALVTFKAPLAVSSVRDQYKLRWQRSGGIEESVNVGEGDVAAGQELTVRTGVLPSGSTTLNVVFQHANGPALLEGPGTAYVPVGTTTVTAPG